MKTIKKGLEAKAMIHRLPTGVPGLDEVLGGGLPELSFNLIAGPPGSGKTTLAHQLMFSLASPERRALYFTVLGEPPLKMLRYQQQYEFFDLDKVNRAIRFVNLSDEASADRLDKVLGRMAAEVSSYSPSLVFVDSFRSMAIAADVNDPGHLTAQQFVQDLGILLTGWQATTFLIGEYFSEGEPSPVFTVADGLIWLRQSAHRNSVVRQLEIRKMRGQPTEPGLHTFRIGRSGVTVFATPPSQTTEDRAEPPLSKRLSLGVPGLDEMMGGGLPSGYSLLVAGPSGSGKSVLAAAFLVEGARAGETSVIAAFEQRPNRSRGPAIAELVRTGKIGVVDTRTSGLSVDEVSSRLIEEIHRLNATRVVIDSLSGFELALAPTFREDFRESLARMVVALASTGATVLMTSELEDRYTELRFSPYGTAFLTDAIVVQRYTEIDSRLKRVMAVVKVRASAHSDELRLFHIDDSGLCLDERQEGLEGLLAGSPTRRPSKPPAGAGHV